MTLRANRLGGGTGWRSPWAFDAAKETHWAEIKVGESKKVLASYQVGNTPQDIADLIAEIRAAEAGHGGATIGIDVLGGIAGLAQAMVLADGLAVVHVPGLAVGRACRGTTGGEHNSDPKDAKVIADQVRMRDDLRRRPGASTSSCGCWPATAPRSSPARPATRSGCGTCWCRSFPAWNALWT